MQVQTRTLSVFFIVLAAVSVVVWGVGAVADSEPYPLISLPGFGRPPSPEHETWTGETRVIALETNSRTTFELPIEEAFHEAPASFYLDMSYSLAAATGPTPEFQAWADSRLGERLAVGECVTAVEVRLIPIDDPEARRVENRIVLDGCPAANTVEEAG